MNLLPSSATHSDQVTIEGAFHREQLSARLSLATLCRTPSNACRLGVHATWI